MLDQKAHPAAPVVVALCSQIDFTTQDRAYDRLYAAFASGATVVIADFSDTDFCDCGSLHHLVTVQHRAAARKAQLRVVIPPAGLIRRLAALMNLDRQLAVYPTLREAIAAGPPPGPERAGRVAPHRCKDSHHDRHHRLDRSEPPARPALTGLARRTGSQALCPAAGHL
jgi:anti-anti-sigma regulatory factor